MSIQSPELLVIRHYSYLKPIPCTVVSGNTNSFFTVKMLEPANIENSIIKGDPLIFGSLDEKDNVVLHGGNVIAFVEAEGNIVITPDKIFDGSDRRQYERFPVSLSGNLVYYGDTKKRSHAFLKDMSYSGFRLYSNADLSEGDEVEVDVFLHNNMLNVSAKVVRKSVFYGRHEYGVQVIFRDKGSIYATQDFMDKLRVYEKELIKKQLLNNLLHFQVK